MGDRRDWASDGLPYQGYRDRKGYHYRRQSQDSSDGYQESRQPSAYSLYSSRPPIKTVKKGGWGNPKHDLYRPQLSPTANFAGEPGHHNNDLKDAPKGPRSNGSQSRAQPTQKPNDGLAKDKQDVNQYNELRKLDEDKAEDLKGSTEDASPSSPRIVRLGNHSVDPNKMDTSNDSELTKESGNPQKRVVSDLNSESSNGKKPTSDPRLITKENPRSGITNAKPQTNGEEQSTAKSPSAIPPLFTGRELNAHAQMPSQKSISTSALTLEGESAPFNNSSLLKEQEESSSVTSHLFKNMPLQDEDKVKSLVNVAQIISSAAALHLQKKALQDELEPLTRWQATSNASSSASGDIKRLKERIRRVDGEINAQEKTVAIEISLLFNKSKQDQGHVTKFRSESEDLQSQNQRLKDEIKNLNAKLNQNEVTVQAQELRLAKLERLHEAQTATVDQSLNSNLSNLQSQVDNLASKLPKARDQSITFIEKRLSTNDSILDTIQSDLKDLQNQIAENSTNKLTNQEDPRTESRILHIETSINSLNTSIAKFQNVVEELGPKFEELKNETNHKIETLRDILKILRNEQRTQNGKISDVAKADSCARDDLAKLRIDTMGQIHDISTRLTEANTRLTVLSTNCKELEANMETLKIPTSSTVSPIQRETSAQDIVNLSKSIEEKTLRLQSVENGLKELKSSVTKELINNITQIINKRTSTQSKAALTNHTSVTLPDPRNPSSSSNLLTADEASDLQQKLSALQQFVISHEQRLNNFTLEPFLKSIVHAMRAMYPYPDTVVHEMAFLRANDERFTTVTHEMKNMLNKYDTDLKNNVDREELTNIGNKINQYQEVMAVVQQKNIEHQQLIRELFNRLSTDLNLSETQSAVLDGKIKNRVEEIHMMFMKSKKIPPTGLASPEPEDMDAIRKDLASQNERIDHYERKIDQNERKQSKLNESWVSFRKDFVETVEQTRENYDEKLKKIEADVSTSLHQVQEAVERMVTLELKIAELEATDKIKRTEANAQSKTHSRRDTTSPLRPAEHSSRESPLRSNPNYGTSLLRKAKRKRVHSNSNSDTETVEHLEH
jgi:chromosome segregation ATPase